MTRPYTSQTLNGRTTITAIKPVTVYSTREHDGAICDMISWLPEGATITLDAARSRSCCWVALTAEQDRERRGGRLSD